MNTPENPPAFPNPDLRDYFAAMAMPLVVSLGDSETVEQAAERLGIQTSDYNWRTHYTILLAMDAYAIADAMLAERTKTK